MFTQAQVSKADQLIAESQGDCQLIKIYHAKALRPFNKLLNFRT